jgi:hypothetical protein
MKIQKVIDIQVRIDPGPTVFLLFFSLGAVGAPECDANGNPLCFGIPLDQDDAALAAQLRLLARFVTDMAAKDMQANIDAIGRATAPPRVRRAPRQRGSGRARRGHAGPPEEEQPS